MTWLMATLAVAVWAASLWASYRLGWRQAFTAHRRAVELMSRIEPPDHPHRGPMNADGPTAVIRQARVRRRGFTQDES